jgi:peroxiredoxin
MRDLVTGFSCLLIALAATAQSNVPALRLQVLDADTAQPVPNVQVRAWVRATPTDSSGVSLIPLPKPGSARFSYKITLAGEGYVGQSIEWSSALHDKVEDMPASFTAKLEKAVAIGGIVRNDKGEPVPGARVILSGPPQDPAQRVRSVVILNYHSERTDADGRWHFGQAPRSLEILLFRVLHPQYVPALFACEGHDVNEENVTILPRADLLAGAASMVLGHGIELSGRVLDPSGKPVVGATITRNRQWRNSAAVVTTDAGGQFNISNLKPGPIYLTLQAQGLAALTRLLELSNSMPPVTIQMAPGNIFKGRVVDPSGKAIAGATVQMDRSDFGPMEYDWSATTDSQGRFAWDSAPEGAHPYFFFAAGYHPRCEPDLTANGEDRLILLRPKTQDDKTTIDGRVTDLASKKPLREFTVYVKQFKDRAVSHFVQKFTNADGRYAVSVATESSGYVISVAAPGHRPDASNVRAPGDGDLRLDFAIEQDAAFSGALYCVKGRFIVNSYSGNIAWSNQSGLFSAIVPPPFLSAQDPEARRREFEKFLDTPEGKAWQHAKRSYELEMDGAGAFSVQDVPEGNYRMAVRLHQSQAEGGGLIAELSTNIEVSAVRAGTNATMDLGAVGLALKLQTDLQIGTVAPSFETVTVDGAPLRLADFRGKYVLLDFWAVWCQPCVHEVPYLKATHDAFGANPRFTMISLSLDPDAFTPKEFAREKDIKWTQGFLGEWSKSSVTGLYGVEGIPAIFLIAPDGKIIARDLRGNEIKEAVGRALGNH